MEALKFGQTAKDHFESIMPGNVTHGWEKYVVTDGETCLLVRSDYKPEPSQMVFLCSIRNGTACVELYRAGKVNKFSTMNALQYGQKVKDHFESIMPGNIAHGWKKYMATDGEICLNVEIKSGSFEYRKPAEKKLAK